MGLTRYEQETTINFNAEGSQATIYTSDPVWMRKLHKLKGENDTEFELVEQGTVGGEVISETYSFPKKLITIRPKAVTRTMTDEQRRAAGERLRKGREKNEVSQRKTDQ